MTSQQQSSEEEDSTSKLAGCGLGLYALLLFGIFTVGIVGIGVSTWAIMKSENIGPSLLSPGHEVPVWKIQPMRDVDIVALTEVPIGYHDESQMRDGTTACAIMKDRVVKVDQGSGVTVRLDDLSQVELIALSDGLDPDERVDLYSRQSGATPVITCLFRASEGASRFANQLQAELLK